MHTINGGKIIGRRPASFDGSDVILVYIPYPHGNEFVTGIVSHMDEAPTEWYWGHYFMDIVAATDNFVMRSGG